MVQALERFALARMIRARCPGCGSRPLSWFLASEAPERIGSDAAHHLLVRIARPEDASCWHCSACDRHGVVYIEGVSH